MITDAPGGFGVNFAKRDGMKKNPVCAEDIQDSVIKHKHCGGFPDASIRLQLAEKKVPWYFQKSFIIFAICGVGPLALPLILCVRKQSMHGSEEWPGGKILYKFDTSEKEKSIILLTTEHRRS